MKKTIRRFTALTMAAFAVLMASTTSAHASVEASGELIAYVGGGVKCATPKGNSTANGTELTFWDCTQSDMQTFQWKDGLLHHWRSGKCVTPRGNAYATNGAVLTLWTCGAPHNEVQRFDVGDRYYSQTNTRTYWGNKCITGYGNGTSNGTTMTLWSCASPVPATQNWGMWR
ncbi:hypothetical protein E2C00_00205 [Streptomyces sp. WAC05374]|uniref:RICIN domain-containing protein n=1 Tax=Streptomyces sp. WAC05374 TaxID=2487420 RepID=UPI000F88A0F7|nr:RICIN domain-containing protein [Streptomyces sp. WAC05374]RST19646.1 hypothetical protein EF905_00745 [Streptomyces sp. WAC05374]TDF50016.1 hypothetical protein E2B92_00175 [Streptomyces sp. WAC05374]TDF57743.1 hypothetical protein E2C02_07970 [Streptomyces sp. WAC05374]TDF60271.1 hypothetical protein E2C00_00205 [Streptomyces sp. WAC05374]